MWTLVYPAAVMVLFAASSSAEERHLAVAEWQTLLPIAFWKQWLIKFGVTWLLAVLFGLVLPGLIVYFKSNELNSLDRVDLPHLARVFLSASFALVVITMYVSSLCDTGLKAVLAALWVILLAAYGLMQAFNVYAGFVWTRDAPRPGERELRDPAAIEWWTYWEFWPFLASIFGLIALTMIFAMRNHQFAERGLHRILRQVFTLVVYQALMILVFVLIVVGAALI
jgi:hypothetical protein